MGTKPISAEPTFWCLSNWAAKYVAGRSRVDASRISSLDLNVQFCFSSCHHLQRRHRLLSNDAASDKQSFHLGSAVNFDFCSSQCLCRSQSLRRCVIILSGAFPWSLGLNSSPVRAQLYRAYLPDSFPFFVFAFLSRPEASIFGLEMGCAKGGWRLGT